jgi:hypothetical protein
MSLQEVRIQKLDKFYTREEVARECIESVGEIWQWVSWSLVVEPSAGAGSFYLQIPSAVQRKVALDLAPEHLQIKRQDFFTWLPEGQSSLSRILVIGNPPFGRVCSLAIRFFLHAASFADVIAFIVPRTFRRISVQEKLPKNFHLRLDKDIPIKPCAFEPPMNVKCCWQVWEKRSALRESIVLETSHPHWEFLSSAEGAGFAIRAYGGKCGEVSAEGLSSLSVKSWHWIRCRGIESAELIYRFQSLDYSCSENTARQNSIGRGELVMLYKRRWGV